MQRRAGRPCRTFLCQSVVPVARVDVAHAVRVSVPEGSNGQTMRNLRQRAACWYEDQSLTPPHQDAAAAEPSTDQDHRQGRTGACQSMYGLPQSRQSGSRSIVTILFSFPTLTPTERLRGALYVSRIG